MILILHAKLLQRIAELPFDGGFHDVDIEGHSEEETSYHILLLQESGLVEAINLSSSDGVCWRPKWLTYAGNEFLAAAESDTVWKNAKGIVWTATKTITLEALKTALPIALKTLVLGSQ